MRRLDANNSTFRDLSTKLDVVDSSQRKLLVVRSVRWSLSTSDATTRYRIQWITRFFKFKINFADPEWFGATAVSDFFGCQWRNELSISGIGRVRCVSGANSVICGRSAELFSNFGKLEAANQLPAAASDTKTAHQLLKLAAETVRSATHVTSSSTWSQN